MADELRIHRPVPIENLAVGQVLADLGDPFLTGGEVLDVERLYRVTIRQEGGDGVGQVGLMYAAGTVVILDDGPAPAAEA